MNRDHARWHSPALDRDMELLVFGHAGARVLAFPTSMGRFYQWEDFGMVEALGQHLEQGWLQLYCVDSIDEETWYAKTTPPAERVRRHEQYERYLLEEVLPFSHDRNPNPYLDRRRRQLWRVPCRQSRAPSSRSGRSRARHERPL